MIRITLLIGVYKAFPFIKVVVKKKEELLSPHQLEGND
jgi:hypothetical protein